jgi:UPF0755 protein
MKGLLTGARFTSLVSGRKKWAVSAVALFVAICSARYGYFLAVPHGNGQVIRIVELVKGSSLRKFAGELETEGIIGSAGLFQFHARLRKVSSRVQAGTYQLDDGMTPGEILRKLVAGEIYEKKFALPEGYSMYQVAELLDAKGFFTGRDFLDACRDERLLRELGIKGESVEGYLYPGTYNLLKVSDASALVKLMAEQFARVYEERFAMLEKSSRLNRRQIITLASIVEKEAVVPQERPLIASVFYNRLRKGMPLQSDPTALYGVRTFGGKVSGSDVRRSTAYNTYRINGLPPGPIGNPGAGAIEAVLKPAVSQYYYFVAKNDGTHHFSATLDEHNRAVNRYLKGKETR